jgi:hypothetical protein
MIMTAIAGRRRKGGVRRYPGGQIRHCDRLPEETVDEIQATVIAYRLKLGLPPQSDERAESPFGRLAYTGVISPRQYRAGCRLAAIWDDYAFMQGFPRKWPKPLDIEGGSRGLPYDPFDLDGAPTPDERKARQAAIDRIKRGNAEMDRLLSDLEQSPTYRGTTRILRDVILYRKDIEQHAEAIGNLRAGLNVVARFLGIN